MPKPLSLVPEEATIGKNGKRVCGAQKKNNQGRCQRRDLSPQNGRCRIHNGQAPRGAANPLTKTGKYSRDLPTRVAARYESALTDPTLLSVRDDVALLQAAITDIMGEIKDAEGRPDLDAVLGVVEKITREWQGWDWTRMDTELGKLKELITSRQSERQAMRDVRILIKEKAQLVAQENKLLLERQQMISVEQFVLAMTALGAAVRRLVDDPVKLRAIDVEFRRIASVPERTG